MISIICEHCKETLSNGVGRWVAQDGHVTFYCGECEARMLVAAVKAPAKPKPARKPKAAPTTEALVTKA